MPFSDLTEAEKDMEFEKGVELGKWIALSRPKFLRKKFTKKEMMSKEFANIYDKLFNKPRRK